MCANKLIPLRAKPMTPSLDRRMKALASMILAAALLVSNGAGADNTHRNFYPPESTGSYSKPVAVESATNFEDALRIEKDNFLPLNPEGQAGRSNSALELTALGATRSRSIGESIAPDGETYLTFRVRVTNVHAKGQVSQDALDGKQDRTNGLGSVFGGGSAEPSEKVSVDYTVEIKELVDHFYGLANGTAFRLSQLTSELNAQLNSRRAVQLTKQGESTVLNLVFQVPQDSNHVGIRYFDINSGDITLPVSGITDSMMGNEAAVCPLVSMNHPLVEICVHELTQVSEFDGYSAAAGHRLMQVRFSAESLATAGDVKAVLELKPDEYLWLKDIDNHFESARPVSPRLLTFSYDFPTMHSVVFEVADSFNPSDIVMQVREEVISAQLASIPESSPSSTIGTFIDGEKMSVTLHGLSRDGEHLIADIEIQSLQQSLRLPILATNRFQLLNADKAISIDRSATEQLHHGKADKFEIPPTEAFRFEVAYKTDDLASALRVRGYDASGDIDVTTGEIIPVETAEIGSQSTENIDESVSNNFQVTSENTDATGSVSVSTAAQTGQRSDDSDVFESMEQSLGQPEALQVNLESDVTEISEVEPNDFRDAPMELGELKSSIVVSGQYDVAENDKYDSDFYTIDIKGEPFLWFFSLSGDAITWLSVIGEADTIKFQARATNSSPTILIPNALLKEGRYFIEVRSEKRKAQKKDADLKYTLNVSPLRAPSPVDESEPNNTFQFAEKLNIGDVRAGYLNDVRDTDSFSFSITAENEKLAYLIKSPAGMKISMSVEEILSGTARGLRHSAASDKNGRDLRGVLSLLPGSYVLNISNQSPVSELEPYQILLERLNRFDQITDLEPNNRIENARLLPPYAVVKGDLMGHRDIDWYFLPEDSGLIQISAPGTDTSKSHPRIKASFHDKAGKRVATLKWDKELAAYVGEYDSNDSTYLQIAGSSTAYTITRSDESLLDTAVSGSLSVELLETELNAESFIEFAQQLEVPVKISNASDTTQQLVVSAHSSDYGWQATAKDSVLEIGANESVETTVSINVSPDAAQVDNARVDVQVRNNKGHSVTDSAALIAECGFPAINPYISWQLPEALLGGRNVASELFGATLHNTERYGGGRGKRHIKEQGFLINTDSVGVNYWDVAVQDEDISGREVFVKLAGDQPTLVSGSILQSAWQASAMETPSDVEIFTSLDDSEYQSVWRGQLTLNKTEHSIVFDTPVLASYAKLVVHAAGHGSKKVSLGSWKMVAKPGSAHSTSDTQNILLPVFGGHLVSASTPSLTTNIRKVVAEPLRDRADYADYVPDSENSWTIGFHHQRVARLSSIQWNHAKDEKSIRTRAAGSVVIEASINGPLGPWEPLGQLNFGDDVTKALTAPEVLQFSKPVWARYLRFSLPEIAEKRQLLLPQSIEVIEHAEQDDYLSILGEWGDNSNNSYYEVLNPTIPQATTTGIPDNNTRADAAELPNGSSSTNQVLLGEYDNWYFIDVEKGQNKIELEVTGDPSLSMQFSLYSEDETPVQLLESILQATKMQLSAKVKPGRYYLHVIEPPRTIVIAWDTSDSVRSYRQAINKAIDEFTQQVQPGREFVNLMPFNRSHGLLLDEFSDSPQHLNSALRSKQLLSRFRYGSSDAEGHLLEAVNTISPREGTKAVLLLTDAASGSNARDTVKLWNELYRVKPRIFTLAIHTGQGVEHLQDKMQSWAFMESGYYSPFTTISELSHGFQRASCHLRRPAGYSIASSVEFEAPPKPGSIQLVEETQQTELSTSGALELILDASGSMHKKLGDSTRLNVAKDILGDLVTNVIPVETPVALRVFGNREERSCRTDLEIPLAAGNQAKLAELIKNVNAQPYAKTPLADSLRLVASDLKTVAGAKNVILVTDGEESCDGDPAAAISKLREQGIDVRINIVGFAIDDKELKDSFASWAELGGGSYFDAPDAATLKAGLQQALKHPFEVLDDKGVVVASGIVGGSPVSVPEGDYQIRVLSDPIREINDIEVLSGIATLRSIK